MSRIEIIKNQPPQTLLACRLVYEAVQHAAGSHRSALLQARSEALVAHVQRTAARSTHVEAPGQGAAYWLKATFRQDDDALRRAAVATLAQGLDARVAGWPVELQALHMPAHVRLAAFLSGRRPYNDEVFSRDVGFAAGLASPAGALSVSIPPPPAADSLAPRARRAAGAFCRQVLQYGAEPARAWLTQVGAQPWAELHVDLRTLEDFNADGFVRCYHRLAALMRTRPDLAGVCGASWLYDPQLAHISPGLAFVRRTAEDGGGRLIRLKTAACQRTMAIARSPIRRQLMESGRYRPACYGMFWTRAALLVWSEQALAKAAAETKPHVSPKHLQAVRK